MARLSLLVLGLIAGFSTLSECRLPAPKNDKNMPPVPDTSRRDYYPGDDAPTYYDKRAANNSTNSSSIQCKALWPMRSAEADMLTEELKRARPGTEHEVQPKKCIRTHCFERKEDNLGFGPAVYICEESNKQLKLKSEDLLAAVEKIKQKCPCEHLGGGYSGEGKIVNGYFLAEGRKYSVWMGDGMCKEPKAQKPNFNPFLAFPEKICDKLGGS